MFLLLIFIFLILVFIIFLVVIYNSLVRLKNNISKSYHNIDILLKQRYDELPKLLSTVKGYMKYEQNVLKEITKARTNYEKASSLEDIVKSDYKTKQAVNSLFAVVEKYPDLKANNNFIKLQTRITELENMIADRREFFNDCVTTYNTRIDQIPYNIISKLLKYKKKELFDIKEFEKNKVNIEI